jgi:hypothetical protein
MFSKRRLACSFCRRSEDEVAKLVAGPHVYICDQCVEIASRIMKDVGPQPRRTAPRPGLVRRIATAIARRLSPADADRLADSAIGV